MFCSCSPSTTVIITTAIITTHYGYGLLCTGPPNILVPFPNSCHGLAVPSLFFFCTILGNLGAFVPDIPGDPI